VPIPAISTHCTRNFMHICPFSPSDASINTKFHVHFSWYWRIRPIILEFSCTIPLIPALRANGTRFIVLITRAICQITQKRQKKDRFLGSGPCSPGARSYWIGVERNHTVLLLYVYVFILSTTFFSAYICDHYRLLANGTYGPYPPISRRFPDGTEP